MEQYVKIMQMILEAKYLTIFMKKKRLHSVKQKKETKIAGVIPEGYWKPYQTIMIKCYKIAFTKIAFSHCLFLQ